jgi:hypothetical protein
MTVWLKVCIALTAINFTAFSSTPCTVFKYGHRLKTFEELALRKIFVIFSKYYLMIESQRIM